MDPKDLELLLSLARAGLAARVERMGVHQMSAAASALAAGEGYLVVLRTNQPPEKSTVPGGQA